MSTIPRKFKQLARSLRDEDGLETLEVVVWSAVIIGVLVLAAAWIMSMVNDAMSNTQLPSL